MIYLKVWGKCSMSHKSDYIKKLNLKCKCGRPAIDFDSRFTSYTPCEIHSKESPVEYSNRVYTGVSTELEDAFLVIYKGTLK